MCRRLAMLGAAAVLFTVACGAGTPDRPNPDAAPSIPPGTPRIDLTFTYGSEKEEWIKDVTAAFHADASRSTLGGKRIVVNAIPMGSGESIDEIVDGTRQVHLTSPASVAFVKLGNARWRAKTNRDLLPSTESLVLSPVVIAMWKPMAEALGWGKKPIGWGEILTMARSSEGWAALGKPQWGRFKFGHTHPEYSNSGLISLFAEAYAAAGKTTGLQAADLVKPDVARYVSDIEKAVVHYGSSTGFFGRKMFANGPDYLSAAVLYENMVIEANSEKYSLPFPVVAIYPREGTFWSDHPVGIVEREWVTPEHREAANAYVKFLLDRPRQERALAFGFRPSSPDIAVTAPIEIARGVDPKQPQTTLEVPSADVIDSVIRLWQRNKKHANVTLVIDVSGSMKEEGRMTFAKAGAKQFVATMKDEDTLSVLPFNSQLLWAARGLALGAGRARINEQVESLFPDGGTALYDAVESAYAFLAENPQPDRISAVVVLTDGADTHSTIKLEALLQQVRLDAEKRPIRIFTIGYGAGANKDILQAIADATQGRFFEGTPQNIQAVFREISTFF
jgi:Ca-activated chloride channel family protein